MYQYTNHSGTACKGNRISVVRDSARWEDGPHPVPVGQMDFSKIAVAFDDSWDGLACFAQFFQSGMKTPVDVIVQDGDCMVPSCLKAGKAYISFFGYPDDGSTRIAVTCRLEFPVQTGRANGSPAIPPTPDAQHKLMREYTDKLDRALEQSETTLSDNLKEAGLYFSEALKKANIDMTKLLQDGKLEINNALDKANKNSYVTVEPISFRYEADDFLVPAECWCYNFDSADPKTDYLAVLHIPGIKKGDAVAFDPPKYDEGETERVTFSGYYITLDNTLVLTSADTPYWDCTLPRLRILEGSPITL